MTCAHAALVGYHDLHTAAPMPWGARLVQVLALMSCAGTQQHAVNFVVHMPRLQRFLDGIWLRRVHSGDFASFLVPQNPAVVALKHWDPQDVNDRVLHFCHCHGNGHTRAALS
jgi:hypothetical protein